ncbi:MAG: rRNA maturation RNase YbeY [Deltaproteobacteria bacterium]|nr:rRNA maturation RNase YbeY [Deltaproteobacteria bacterium]
MKKVLEDLGCHDRELSIVLTDDESIAELNRQYLGRQGPTNVLAFPMSGGPPPRPRTGMMGDIVVSVDRAIAESDETGETPEEALFRLLIHGVLHLLGFDHEKSIEESQRMEEEQGRLLARIMEE